MTIAAELSNSVDSQQMDRGLTVFHDNAIDDIAANVRTSFADFLASLSLNEYGFRYLSESSDISLFDEIGDQLFAMIATSINYERRNGPGDIIETAGFIVYPANNSGTGRHRDTFFGETMIRLTLPILGEGNFWSTATGEVPSKVGSLLIQNLCNGCEHSADTLGFEEPRVVAFWDIPADRRI